MKNDFLTELNKYEKEQIRNGDWIKAIQGYKRRHPNTSLNVAHRIVEAYKQGRENW